MSLSAFPHSQDLNTYLEIQVLRVNLWIDRFEVATDGWDDASFQGEDSLDHSCHTTSTLEVSNVRLDGAARSNMHR